MKITFTNLFIVLEFILLASTSFSQNNEKQIKTPSEQNLRTNIETAYLNPNAHLLSSVWGYTLVLPDSNILNYLGHKSLTAFNFVNAYEPSRLSTLNIETFKQRYLEWSENIIFEDIKGFELYDTEIAKANEFELKEKRNFYIQKLIDCWGKYKEEYENIYLKGYNGVYIYPELIGYGDNEGTNRFELNKTAYNFDNETLKMNILNANFLHVKNNNIEIKLPISEAKILFGDGESCYYQSIVKVKPKTYYRMIFRGDIAANGVQYEVVEVKKYFFKINQWSDIYKKFTGDPIYTLTFESSISFPLSELFYRVYVNSLKSSLGFDEFATDSISSYKEACGTYTLYDQTTGIKKMDINIYLINPINNTWDLKITRYFGRSGRKKESKPKGESVIKGNALFTEGNVYSFVKYNDLRGLLYLEGNSYIFLERTQ